MSDHGATLEDCIDQCDGLTDAEVPRLRAELRELRRQAWNWREARAIVQQAAERKAILFGALDPWGRDLIGLILGDGDAEWERKANEAHGGER